MVSIKEKSTETLKNELFNLLIILLERLGKITPEYLSNAEIKEIIPEDSTLNDIFSYAPGHKIDCDYWEYFSDIYDKYQIDISDNEIKKCKKNAITWIASLMKNHERR